MSGSPIKGVPLNVTPNDGEPRLDRYLRRKFPTLSQGRIEMLLRKGAIRVDGAKAKANDRLDAGQQVVVPYGLDSEPPPTAGPKVSPEDAEYIKSLLIYEDQHVLVINKPAGIAVQGGSKTIRHLDFMFQALADPEHGKPKLVHRLDRDTTGVLVVGRNPMAAAALAKSFQTRKTKKIYWAVVLGVPNPKEGEIRGWMKKAGSNLNPDLETMRRARHGDKEAVFAITDFAVISNAATRASWVALKPVTGRTHQLRFHMAEAGTAIVGDNKYTCEREMPGGIENVLHLHARAIEIPHPLGGLLRVQAPLPPHMEATFNALGFDERDEKDPFKVFERR
jgi:23S rRNA pseudouridine955/2504/2580 synthase